MRIHRVIAAIVFAGLLSTPMAALAQGTDGACDRRCLLRILTGYTEAITDNDASRLAVTPGPRRRSDRGVQLRHWR